MDVRSCATSKFERKVQFTNQGEVEVRGLIFSNVSFPSIMEKASNLSLELIYEVVNISVEYECKKAPLGPNGPLFAVPWNFFGSLSVVRHYVTCRIFSQKRWNCFSLTFWFFEIFSWGKLFSKPEEWHVQSCGANESFLKTCGKDVRVYRQVAIVFEKSLVEGYLFCFLTIVWLAKSVLQLQMVFFWIFRHYEILVHSWTLNIF